ncbi:MAG TPA: hypothetical protein VHK65_05450 [Candidatus Dormibacteraeota bacterium]|nr:hypothetical protein [Candidatus Dormibacteraeota bacterium]
MGYRFRAAISALSLALVAVGLITFGSPSGQPAPSSTGPHFASVKGLNYGIPLGLDGRWIGTTWLRSGTGVKDNWNVAYPQIVADLDFVQQRHLGRVIRLFIGLDQLMEWNDGTGFIGFHEGSLANFQQMVSLFAARDLQMVAVLYDQEETSSPGNFHFEALDGQHAEMRAGYLRATQAFMARFGSEPAIVAWDLFNEAYGSLGPDAGHPPPPAGDPISPNFPDSIVHGFLHDLYSAAKAAAPHSWLTVSDGNLYVQPAPDLSRFDDILDFYDLHIYEDHPALRELRRRLDKPFILGEAGASLKGDHLHDQRIEATAVRDFLDQAIGSGALAVLMHSISDQNLFLATHDRLTPAGEVLSSFSGQASGRAKWPIVSGPGSTVLFVKQERTRSLTVLHASAAGATIRPGGKDRWNRGSWPYLPSG